MFDSSRPVHNPLPSLAASESNERTSFTPHEDERRAQAPDREQPEMKTTLGANIHAQTRRNRDRYSADAVHFFTPSKTTANRSDEVLPFASEDDGQPPASNWDRQGTETAFGAQYKRNGEDRSIISERQPVNSPPPFSNLNRSDDMPMSSDSENEARAKKERHEMKAVLKSKILAADTGKTASEQDKFKRTQLLEFKLKMARKTLDARPGPSAAGPSSLTRKHGRCAIKMLLFHTHSHIPDIRQPTMLSRLSPPPKSTPSQNPYAQNGKQTKHWRK
jgi:hypothetical protein